MPTNISITEAVGESLAQILGEKIVQAYPEFDTKKYVSQIQQRGKNLNYTKRIELHAQVLKELLPQDYLKALEILTSVLGPENPNETGMFTSYYWIMPIAKFVQLFGLDHYDESIKAIEEITKRNTGEYAIRPFIEKYPQKTLKIMTKWAKSKNFHLRRLASEGLRPKLPWAPKLDAFNDSPEPVFELLELLKEDDIKFVKKSVANHLRDWTKVNPDKANPLLNQWAKSDNPHTQWIVKHARR
jgi:3-methyladenine DNA glycosylase AlkC